MQSASCAKSGNDVQPLPELLNPRETSEILGVSVGTLAVWRCTNRYPLPYVKVGRVVRYRYGDVLDFLDSQTITPSIDA